MKLFQLDLDYSAVFHETCILFPCLNYKSMHFLVKRTVAFAQNKTILLDVLSNKIQFLHSVSHKGIISQLKVPEAPLPEQKMANSVLVKIQNETERRGSWMKLYCKNTEFVITEKRWGRMTIISTFQPDILNQLFYFAKAFFFN